MEDQYSEKFYEKIEAKLPEPDPEIIRWQYSLAIFYCINYLEELQEPESTPRIDVKHPFKKSDIPKMIQEGSTVLVSEFDDRTYKLTTDDFNSALKEMLNPQYETPDIVYDFDEFYKHLIVAGDFFTHYRARHSIPKITELMKLSTTKLVAEVHEIYGMIKTKTEDWSIDKHLNQVRIERGAKAKQQKKLERKQLVLEAYDKIQKDGMSPHKIAKAIRDFISKTRKDPPSIKTIERYLKEEGLA